jgi:4-hydroxy-tetrahydrodipicolinate synthase
VLVPTGSTGEFYALSRAEHMKVIETVIDTSAGAVPVVAGTAAAGTREAIALALDAQHAGVDGVQVVLPYYHVPSEEGLYGHFAAIADAVDVGVMIYNNPAVSKLWMPPHVMRRCSEHPNIVADKENTDSVVAYMAVRDAVEPSKMSVLCGLGDLQFAYTAALGCPGFVSWTANFAPDLALALLEAADAVDFKRVREIAARTGRLYTFAARLGQARGRDPWVFPSATAGHIYVAVMKAALEELGLAGGPVRQPLEDITAEEREELRSLLKTIRIT